MMAPQESDLMAEKDSQPGPSTTTDSQSHVSQTEHNNDNPISEISNG